jgi:hypothetical protein
MLVHLGVENMGDNAADLPSQGTPRYTRLGLLTVGGATAGYTAIRVITGALDEDAAGLINFPSIGKRGAFVMEFLRPKQLRTFSIVVNDQPLFSSINLRTARFASF